MAKSSTLKSEFSALRTRSLRCFCPSRVRKRATTVQPGNQLTNEQRSGTNGYNDTYSWDPVGNRSTKVTSAGTTNNTFNAANELTVSTPPTGSPTTSSYDGNGNVTLENTGGALTSYSWDSENRMLSAVDATGSTTNTYNAQGLRQSKNVAGTVTNYLWDGQNVLAELDSSLVIQAVYTDLPAIWGSAFSLHRSGASSFYLPDHQGNTRQLSGAAQTVTDTLLTDAWGVELASTGTTVNPYRAFGQWGYYRDTAGRLYARARDLEVAQGRWLGTANPEDEEPAGGHAYARGNPIIYIVGDGFAPSGYGRGRTAAPPWKLKCPIANPIKKGEHGDFSMACSKKKVDSISATFTLPAFCWVPGGFINFYLSMGGYEGGVSFSPPGPFSYDGWNSFMNCSGEKSQEPIIPIYPDGGPVTMTLLRISSGPLEGLVWFTIAQGNRGGLKMCMNRLLQSSRVSVVNASTAGNCHSTAAWSDIKVDGGLYRPAATWPKPPAYTIDKDDFASHLRSTNVPCDKRQYGH